MAQQGRKQLGPGMRRDDLGMLVPFGMGGNPEKELLKLGKDGDVSSVLAGMIMRGRLTREEGGHIQLLADIGEDDPGNLKFIANYIATRLAQDGLARNEYLMGLARMLVPSVMPRTHFFREEGQRMPQPGQERGKVMAEETE